MIGLKVYKKHDSNAKKTLGRSINVRELPKNPEIEGFDKLRNELIKLKEGGRKVYAWAAISNFFKKLRRGDTAIILYSELEKYYIGEYYGKFEDPQRKLEVHFGWGTGRGGFPFDKVLFLLDVEEKEISRKTVARLKEIGDNRYGAVLTGENEEKVRKILRFDKPVKEKESAGIDQSLNSKNEEKLVTSEKLKIEKRSKKEELRELKEKTGSQESPPLPSQTLRPLEIKATRTKLNLTQKQLAELVGVTSSYISQIESGSANPRNSTLEKITKALFDVNSGERATVKQRAANKKKEETKEKVSDFVATLEENIEGYSGTHSNIIKYAPDVFGLFQTLSEGRNLESEMQNLIDSVITYFVLPHDALPEAEMGPIGYIDDLYLCAYVINELGNREDIRRRIWDCWDNYKDVFQISTQIIEEIEDSPVDSVNEALLEEVLDRVGLKKREKGPKTIEKKIEKSEKKSKVKTEASIKEKKVCSKCGKELSNTAHPWTQYCDKCAKIIYGSSESIVDDIKWILSDMEKKEKSKTSVNKARKGSLKTEALARLKGFVSEVLAGKISYKDNSIGALDCSHLTKKQANMLKKTMKNFTENTDFNGKIAVRSVNFNDERKRKIEIELLVPENKLPSKNAFGDIENLN